MGSKTKFRTIERPRKSDFLRTSVLAASLMLSSCAAIKPTTIISTPQATPVKVICGDKTATLRKGNELVIGVTPRAAYKITVTDITPEIVETNLSIPVMMSDGIRLINLGVGFQGVEFKRTVFQSFVERECGQVEEINNRNRKKETQKLEMLNVHYKSTESLEREDMPIIGICEVLGLMMRKGAINHAVGHLILMKDGIGGDGSEIESFKVKNQKEGEYVIEIDLGKHTGEQFRLSSKLDLSVDRILPIPAFVSMPLKIQAIEIRDSQFFYSIAVDCTREVEMGLGNEVQHEINPNCR